MDVDLGRAIFSVVALIVDREKKLVLAVSRKDDPNDFGLPGGKVEPGESPQGALRRELCEETGLIATSIKPVYDRTDTIFDNGKICRCYLVEQTFGEIKTEEKGVVKWVSYSELLRGTFGSYNAGLFEERRDLFW